VSCKPFSSIRPFAGQENREERRETRAQLNSYGARVDSLENLIKTCFRSQQKTLLRIEDCVTSPSKRRRVSLEQADDLEEDDLAEDVLPDNDSGPNVETDTTVISRQTVVASNAVPTTTLVRRFVKQECGKEIMHCHSETCLPLPRHC
jgi:hypothetical protein